MLLGGIVKVLKYTDKSIWLKIKSTEKLPKLPFSYRHIVNKIPIVWGRLPAYLIILDLLSSSNLCYWEKLLEFS